MSKANFVKQQTLDNENLPDLAVGGSVYKGRDPVYQQVGGQFVKVLKGVPYVKVRDLEEGEA